MVVSSQVFAELNSWLRLRHEWGRADCVTVLADWVLRVRGFDPMAGLRLTYGSAGECERVTRFFSAPVALFASRLEPMLARTDSPRRGDVAVLRGLDGRPCGGLCLGAHWGSFFESGGAMAWRPPVIEAAWRVLDG